MDRLDEFVGVPLSADLNARLLAQAKSERRSKAAIVRLALYWYLAKIQEATTEGKDEKQPDARH